MAENHSHKISRVLAGGLFALFFGSLIQALTVFGVITMSSGHVFMVIAFVAGALLLATEVFPFKRTHKIISIVILALVLFVIDLSSVWYVSRRSVQTATARVPASTASPSPTPSPIGATILPSPKVAASPSPRLPKRHLTAKKQKGCNWEDTLLGKCG